MWHVSSHTNWKKTWGLFLHYFTTINYTTPFWTCVNPDKILWIILCLSSVRKNGSSSRKIMIFFKKMTMQSLFKAMWQQYRCEPVYICLNHNLFKKTQLWISQWSEQEYGMFRASREREHHICFSLSGHAFNIATCNFHHLEGGHCFYVLYLSLIFTVKDIFFGMVSD